jgi:hypothetical protein
MTKTSRNTNVAPTASATTAKSRSTKAKSLLTSARKVKATLNSSAEKATKQKAKVGSSKSAATADVTPVPAATKSATVMTLLRSGEGATLEAMQQATGWQAHSVRGFLSGTVKKRMALSLASERGDDGIRRYRIADAAAPAAPKA